MAAPSQAEMLVALAGVRVRWWLVELGESPPRLVVSAERLTGSEHLLAMDAMEQRLTQAAPKVYVVMRSTLDFSVRVNARAPTTAVMVLERILAGWEHVAQRDTRLRRDPDKEPERLWWGGPANEWFAPVDLAPSFQVGTGRVTAAAVRGSQEALAVLGGHRVRWWVSDVWVRGAEQHVRLEVRCWDDDVCGSYQREGMDVVADKLATATGVRVLRRRTYCYELAFRGLVSVDHTLCHLFAAPMFEHKHQWTSTKLTQTEAHAAVARALVSQGNQQCPEVFATRRGATFCAKRAGHEGDHRGWRKQWNAMGRVPITEKVPE